MVALVVGMMLAGCSKEDVNMETKGNTEQAQTLTKDQIVGVFCVTATYPPLSRLVTGMGHPFSCLHKYKEKII